jgi:uncharacterized protein (TIGR02996 family)
MGFFDLFRRKAEGGRGRIAYLNPVLHEGGILLDDGREIFFVAAACDGFVPEAGQRVEVKAVVARAAGGQRATVVRRAPDEVQPSEPTPPAPAPPASPARGERDAELEQVLVRSPDDTETYLVYGDWLQARGDPRGELIALQHRRSERPDDPALERAERHLIEQHADLLLGDLALHREALELEWHLGFLRSARIAGPTSLRRQREARASCEEVLRALLRHPSVTLLRGLGLGVLPADAGDPFDGPLQVLEEAGPRPTLRRLFLGDFVYPDEMELSWVSMPATERLYPLYPGLVELTLQAGHFELGRLELPALRSFELRTGGLDRASLRAILEARWPALERLVIWFGDPNYGADSSLDDLQPLLDATAAPAGLRHLGLMNCEHADELCSALARSALLPRLEVLDLSLGTLSDAGAAALLAGRERFAHLRRLNLAQSYLTDAACRELSALCAEVVTDEQREAEEVDADGNAFRYVSVGE